MDKRITTRQRKLAQVIIENSRVDKPLNAGQMLDKVGYSKNLVKQPGRVIKLNGVQLALEEYGFTEDNAKNVVAEILLNKKAAAGDRLRAASEVFKVKGSYAPEKSQALNLNLNASSGANSDFEALRLEFEEKLKSKLNGIV